MTDVETMQLIDERDTASEAADELAKAIAEYFDVEVGEHSNLNDPWLTALAGIRRAIAAKRVDAVGHSMSDTNHLAFTAAERLAPVPATREQAATDSWVRHYAALALAAGAVFDDAVRTIPAGAAPGSRPDLGYLATLANAAIAAAYAFQHVEDYAPGLWDLTPEAGALNGEWVDWLTDTLDRYGINPADIDPRFVATDFRSPSQAVTR